MTSIINKILASCVLAFSFVLVYSVALAATQPATVVGSNVNIRVSPSTSGDVVSKLTDAKVSVVDRSGDWYKINFSKKSGWVIKDYIKVSPAKGVVNADGVNFREKANTDCKVLAALEKGTSVQILDTQSGWHKIKISSRIGYVSTEFVSNATGSVSRSNDGNVSDVSDNDDINRVVDIARELAGCRYVYGGSSPSGFDCSGFVGYAYKKATGITLNRSASDMSLNGTRVSKGNLRVGDLIFFDASSRKSSGEIDHVGIYLGNNAFIHASTSKRKVVIDTLSNYQGTYITAKRIIK